MGKKNAQAASTAKPSLVLLALVDQFLVDNGFSSSSRIFQTALKKRPKSEGWVGIPGKDYTADVPNLGIIFQQWEEANPIAGRSEKDVTASHTQDTSSDADSNNSTSSDSDSESDDDEEERKEPSQSMSSDSSTASSDSDSDSASGSDTDSESGSDTDSNADDTIVEDRISTITSTKANPLKRKLADVTPSETSSSSEDDTSADESDSSEDERPALKRAKVESSDSESDSDSDSDADRLELAANVRLPSSDPSEGSTSSSDSDSSDDSDDSSDSDTSDSDRAIRKSKAATAPEERLSESSGTVTGDVGLPSSQSNNSAVALTTQVEEVVVKKKHVGARPTRLAELSATANLDDYVSNDYVSYDYAEKAYRDLIVTRGKGFTKEKNKKKRGSYRGGTIDTSGGKGFKFDD